MSPQRFAQIEQVFDQARGLSESQRVALLDSLCADDPDLRAEVENLLRHDVPTPKPLVEQLTRVLDVEEEEDDDPAGTARTRAHKPRRGAQLGTSHLLEQSIGPYQVVRVLGRGGMGVVYLARDERLHRNVAIKALPAEFVDHPARAARFMREARLLASLSHPNIATVFGLEECAGPETGCAAKCLVMEYVEGDSLAQRLKDGALSIEHAVDVCRQVAAGVEAAHAEDVIHRDLKPANVMVGDGGGVKVLDFGLARSVDPPSGTGSKPAAAAAAPGTHVKTQMGAAVGTPGYMSPEQLRGELLDKRTDIFAFGCILYECLTGRVAFAGASAADVATAVLERDPDWSLLPPRTPSSIRRLLARCLARDRNRRLRDIGDARLELEDALDAREWASSATMPAAAASSAQASRRRHRFLVSAALAAIAIAVAGLAVAVLKRPSPPAPSSNSAATALAPLQRYSIGFPNDAVQSNLSHVRLALSRDGAKMIISATDGKTEAIYVRERDRGAFRQIDGTDNAWMPSLSPDGQWVVYFDHGIVRKRPLAGGNPMRVSDVHGYFAPYSWSPDGFISYVPYWSGGIARIPADGGQFEFITKPDKTRGEFAHIAPFTLPDGSAVLYTVWDGNIGTRIDAIDLKTRRTFNVIADGATPRLASTPYGPYLLWARSGTIYAAPFDVKNVRRIGTEVAVADSVLNDRVLFAAAFDVADEGTLAYVPGPTFVEESRLSWVDTSAASSTTRPTKASASAVEAVPLNDDRKGFVEPNFSADGTLLSVILKADVFKPYLYDLKADTLNRIVVDGDVESAAISPEGTRLAYTSNKDGAYDLFLRDLASHSEKKIFQGPGDYPCSVTWSPDGKAVAFATTPDQHSNRDVYVVTVDDLKVTAFCGGKAEERAPRWSPDGKWLAYSSDESGTREVFLRSYPDGRQTRQVSSDGGDWPVWDPGGKRLFYRTRDGVFAVSVAGDGTVTDKPQPIYSKLFGQSDFDLPDYTAAPDGRLLIVEPSERGPKVAQINVLLNWYNQPGIHATR
jgi:Tol biopolymer transport system component